MEIELSICRSTIMKSMITNKKSHILSLYDVWKLRYGMLGRRDVPQKREDHSSSTVSCVPDIS